MLIQTVSPGAGSVNLLRNAFWRELASRQDRVPPDQRIDTREIQESYRVSFSDAVRADTSGATRDSAQQSVDAASPEIRAYQQVAAL